MKYLILLLLPFSALADNYIGLSVGGVDYDHDTFGTLETTGASLRWGADVTPWLSAEIRGGKTTREDTTVMGVEVKGRVDYAVSGLVRVLYPGEAQPYIVVGATRGKATASALGSSASDKDSDISYGVGIDLYGSPWTAITLEWVRYIETDTYELEALSLGILRRY